MQCLHQVHKCELGIFVFKKIFLFYVSLCVFVCARTPYIYYIYTCRYLVKALQVLDSVGLELQMVVSLLVWVLETKALSEPSFQPRKEKLNLETESYCVALAVLDFVMQTRLTSNSQRSTFLCFTSAGIKGVYHHAQL